MTSTLWSLAYAAAVRTRQTLRVIEDQRPTEPSRWPKLSVIVAARNEARDLPKALATLGKLDYPGLELVLVDDRSDDGTGRILDEFAETHSDTRVVHVTSLPEGWTGKLHAMSKGLEVTTGEWVAFVDADAELSPGLLRTVAAVVEAEAADHLTILPEVSGANVLVKVATSAANGVLLSASKATRVGASDRAYIGIGAFNLVRRAALDRTPGLPWLKMELLDDMGIAFLLVSHGARSRFFVTRSAVTLEWYPNLGAMATGLEKIFVRGAGFSVWRLSLQALLFAAFAIAPLPSMVMGEGVVRGIGMATLGLPLLAATVGRRWGAPGPAWALALRPLGQLMLSVWMIRAAWRFWRSGGLIWRGTKYDKPALLAGRRGR